MKYLIINGPNLNLLGKREPELYGSKSFDEYLKEIKLLFPEITIDYYQSNIEGEIIDTLQGADEEYDGIVINAGGYTHTSISIADAISAISTPVVEVHITSILAREQQRHTSLLATQCIGSIMGFGLDSYRLGILALKGQK